MAEITFNDAVPSESPAEVSLCTLEQVKSQIDLVIAGSDPVLERLIAAVLPTFSNRFRREFMPQVTQTRTIDVPGPFVTFGSMDLKAATAVVLHPGTSDEIDLAESQYDLWIDDLTSTAEALMLDHDLDLCSDHSASFGYAKLAITGTWGIWESVSEVAYDVNLAAIETVLAWSERPSSDISMIAGADPRDVGPMPASTWDIPTSAWRKMQPYERPVI